MPFCLVQVKFAEHRCFADVQMSDHVGPCVSLQRIDDYEPGDIGLIVDPTGHRPIRFRRTYDDVEMRMHRVYWAAGERICWDYSGGDDWGGAGPSFTCDCVVCDADAMIPK